MNKRDFFKKNIKIGIITLSDRAFKGEYEDLSGLEIENLLTKFFENYECNFLLERILIPDSREDLISNLKRLEKEKVDYIFTTGGTGVGPRDITVDTLLSLTSKTIPGIMDYIRIKYGETIPNALLSRSIAAIVGESIVYTLPGSVKAVREYVAEIQKTMEHLLKMLHGGSH